MEEYEKGNSNINSVLEWFEEEETINYLSEIMADDFEITDEDKCIQDVVTTYEKEKLIEVRNDILKKMEDNNLTKEEIASLENSLSQIIIKLAKMK